MQSSQTESTSQPMVSIITLDFNEMKYIGTCLESLQQQTYPNFEIIVVDNGSSDGSPEFVRQNYPTVRLIEAGENLGFAGGNNLGAQHANGKYLAFINPDTTVEPDWLFSLVDALENRPEVGMVTPKLLIMAEPDRINTCGNDVQYTGFGFLRGWLQESDTKTVDEDVCSISGGAFLVEKAFFDDLGGFDHSFFPIYVEDTDLSLRTILRGRRNQFIAASKVYHDYTLSFGANKYFRLEKNRYQMLLKVYKWPTLFLLIPAFFLSEVISWGYSIANGMEFIRAKLRSYRWILQNIKPILQARQAVQRSRTTNDRNLLQQMTYRLAYRQANEGWMARGAELIFTPLFFLLYQLYRFIIRW